MRSTASHAVIGGLVTGLAALCGCSSGSGLAKSTGAGGAGAAGGGMTGASSGGASGVAGQSIGGAGGAAGASGGAGGSNGGADAAPSEAGGPTDGGGDASETGDGAAITTIVAAGPGCGTDAPAELVPGMLVKQTIVTNGVKAANCADKMCGAWTDTREYYVRLPTGYDKNKPFPLVLEGPGCGDKGNNLYNIPVFDGSVIRVGLSPSVVWQAQNATRPGLGCFDFTDGDNSVDWPFYEALYDRLAAQVCFDRNRVFVSGSASGGSSFANELGCKYAGDLKRPIRGMMSNSGGFPMNETPVLPTCSDKPMAGMWVAQLDDPSAPFTNIELAVARAMRVDGCTMGTGFKDAPVENFPIFGGNAESTCQKIMGCSPLTPLVVCAFPGNQHAQNANVVVPGFPAFVDLFEVPPLLTQ
jgi:hypothetical protein